MKLRMYAVFSTMAQLFHQDGLFLFNTDEHALHILGQRVGEAEKDNLSVVCVGSFDVVTGEVVPLEPRYLTFPAGSPVDSLPVNQSPISHDPAPVQESKFLERTADIKVRK